MPCVSAVLLTVRNRPPTQPLRENNLKAKPLTYKRIEAAPPVPISSNNFQAANCRRVLILLLIGVCWAHLQD